MKKQVKTADGLGPGAVKRYRKWESNHITIIDARERLMRFNERFPTSLELAAETGLSRVTVNKHLEILEADDVKVMTHLKSYTGKMIAKMVEHALDGDMRATRMALQLLGLIGRRQI